MRRQRPHYEVRVDKDDAKQPFHVVSVSPYHRTARVVARYSDHAHATTLNDRLNALLRDAATWRDARRRT